MAMEIDEVIEEIKSIVTVNTEKQAEALNWAVNYMTLLKSALNNYKDRKVEMVAMLEELKAEIDEKATELCDDGWWLTYNNLIQQKIDKMKQ